MEPGKVRMARTRTGGDGRTRAGSDRATLLLTGLHSCAFAFTMFYLPVYLKGSLGYSGVEVGALLAANNLTAIIAAFPIGLSSDRWRPRPLLAFGLLLLLVAGLTLAEIAAFPLVMGAFIALGLSTNTLRQVLDAVWYRRGDGSASVGSRFGPYLAVRMGGVAIGMFLGGTLLQAIGFETVLLGLAGAALALMLLVPFVPDTPIGQVKVVQYGRDFLRPEVMLFSGWLFLFATHWGAESTSYALFLREGLGLDMSWMGAYMAGELVVLAIASFVVGRTAAAERGALWLLLLGLAISGVFQIGTTLSNPWWSFAARAVHGVGDGIVGIVIYTTVGRLFHLERIGGNAGLVILFLMLGAAAGALIYGPVGSTLGYATPLAASGVVTLVLAAGLVAVAPRVRRS